VLSSVRAIAFDLDNTLWDVEPVLARAEARLLAWLAQHCPRIPQRISPADMRAAREELARREPHHAHDVSYLRQTALAAHAREHGYGAHLAAEAFEVFLSARNEVQLFADVAPGLARLARRYALASLSNGNADLKRIGLAPHQIVYVGDEPLLDVAAARAAGLGSVWMNRRSSPWPAELAAPDLTVPDCEQLAGALGA
jgi:putative hydrolase of the HAD superfamily